SKDCTRRDRACTRCTRTSRVDGTGPVHVGMLRATAEAAHETRLRPAIAPVHVVAVGTLFTCPGRRNFLGDNAKPFFGVLPLDLEGSTATVRQDTVEPPGQTGRTEL